MQVLFLTQILPYPPDAGPRIKTWHVLRYLAGLGHRITLISYVRPDEVEHLPALEAVCAAVHAAPITRVRAMDAFYFLWSQVSQRPFLVERDNLHAMRSKIAEVAGTTHFDVIHADQLTMAQFALQAQAANSRPPRARLVFDAHNAVWKIVERMAGSSPAYLKPLLRLEANRVKQYEGFIVNHFDHTLAVTEIDRELLIEASGRGHSRDEGSRMPVITVVPIAVDTEALQPLQRSANSLNLVTLGTLHYPPNADGIRWFLGQVYPAVRQAVPGVSLTIIGKNPPEDFRQAAEADGSIRVTGYVDDLTPYLEQAALMVVPLRAGGGMRVRILEAFARGMPVVTSPVGLEGIEARPGEEVLVADSPEAFAGEVVRLLQDRELRDRLAVRGRALAEARYDWQVVLKAMAEVYQDGSAQ
jgi:glycosyltransferase involved in cell wall biosynthesis